MKAIWKDTVIAESQNTVVVENNHYFPATDVDSSYLIESDHTSVCPWKGTAHYYNVKVKDDTNSNAAWYYPETKPKADNIKGYIAFWKGVQVVQ